MAICCSIIGSRTRNTVLAVARLGRDRAAMRLDDRADDQWPGPSRGRTHWTETLLARTNRSKGGGRMISEVDVRAVVGHRLAEFNTRRVGTSAVARAIPMVTVTPGWVYTQALVSRLLTS